MAYKMLHLESTVNIYGNIWGKNIYIGMIVSKVFFRILEFNSFVNNLQ